MIFGLLALVRYAANSADRKETSPAAPEQMLAERFARGEIDADEYRHRLETLHASREQGRSRLPTES